MTMSTDTAVMAQQAANFELISDELRSVMAQVQSTAASFVAQWQGQSATAAQAALERFQEASTRQVMELNDISNNIQTAGLHYSATDEDQSSALASQMGEGMGNAGPGTSSGMGGTSSGAMNAAVASSGGHPAQHVMASSFHPASPPPTPTPPPDPTGGLIANTLNTPQPTPPLAPIPPMMPANAPSGSIPTMGPPPAPSLPSYPDLVNKVDQLQKQVESQSGPSIHGALSAAAGGCATGGATVAIPGLVSGPIDVPLTAGACGVGAIAGIGGYLVSQGVDSAVQDGS